MDLICGIVIGLLIAAAIAWLLVYKAMLSFWR